MEVPSHVSVKASISMLRDVTKSAIDKALFFADRQFREESVKSLAVFKQSFIGLIVCRFS